MRCEVGPVIGETLGGRYLITRLLGSGGMAVVYEARHSGTGRRVAVKVINAEFAEKADLIARFQMEARATGEIESQYIAHVLDTGNDVERKAPFIVMEYLAGEDLQRLVDRLGPLPPDLALRMIAQACLGLEKAHAAKIIHRDIKPANMFLTERDGDERLLKLVDFGIAKRTEELTADGVTRPGSLIGSPLYMSPEQARGQKTIDHRTDLWSLGISLYQALTGRTPFDEVEGLGDLIIAICASPARPVHELAPWVPLEVSALVQKALAIDIRARFQSAGEMHRALRALLPGGIAIDSAMVVGLADAARAGTPPGASRSGSGDRDPVATSALPETEVRAELPASAPAILSGASAAARPSLASSPIEVHAGAVTGASALSTSQAVAVAPARARLSIAIGAAGLVAAAIGFVVLRPRSSAAPDVTPTTAALASPPPSAPPAMSAVEAPPAPGTVIVTPAEPSNPAPVAPAAPSATGVGARPLPRPAGSVRSMAPTATATAKATAAPTVDPFRGIRK